MTHRYTGEMGKNFQGNTQNAMEKQGLARILVQQCIDAIKYNGGDGFVTRQQMTADGCVVKATVISSIKNVPPLVRVYVFSPENPIEPEDEGYTPMYVMHRGETDWEIWTYNASLSTKKILVASLPLDNNIFNFSVTNKHVFTFVDRNPDGAHKVTIRKHLDKDESEVVLEWDIPAEPPYDAPINFTTTLDSIYVWGRYIYRKDTLEVGAKSWIAKYDLDGTPRGKIAEWDAYNTLYNRAGYWMEATEKYIYLGDQDYGDHNKDTPGGLRCAHMEVVNIASGQVTRTRNLCDDDLTAPIGSANGKLAVFGLLSHTYIQVTNAVGELSTLAGYYHPTVKWALHPHTMCLSDKKFYGCFREAMAGSVENQTRHLVTMNIIITDEGIQFTNQKIKEVPWNEFFIIRADAKVRQ